MEGHEVGKVHPHVCGENCTTGAGGRKQEGTPPRVWGKLTISLSFSKPNKVHPHVCGENFGAYHGYKTNLGTPPRVWGKRLGPLTV